MANFSGFKNNIQNYLEGQGAGSESEAADYFSSECATIINTATNSLIASEAPTPPGFCSGAFLTAFTSIKSTGGNTPANWLPVATAWGAAISGKAYVANPAAALAEMSSGGMAGVSAAGGLLAQAFGPNSKNASDVATKFKDAIETCCGLAVGTHTTPAGTVSPIKGLS